MLAQDKANLGNSLVRALRGARRSWWRRTFVDAVLIVIIVASVTVVIAWVHAWLLGSYAGQLGASTLLMPVALAAGGGLLLWLVGSAYRAPSLLGLARRVDRLLGQSETFSTSYEVLLTAGPGNVVTRALLLDVEERAKRLDVGPAGWRRGSAWLGWGALLTAIVASALLFVPMPGRQFRTGADQPASNPRTLQDRAQEAATLAGVAELLNLVAEQEASDYLRALGASFSDLAERVGDDAVPVAESNRLAQELTQHLQAASQEVGGRFAGAVSAAFSETPGAIGLGEDPEAAGSAAGPSAAARPGAVRTPAAASLANAEAGSSFYESLNALMDQFEADPTAVGVRPERLSAANTSDGDGFYGGVLNAETDANAAAPQQAALGRAEGEAGGAAAGAAERSTDAAGDAAGQGGADLGAGSASFLDLTTERGAISALERNERDGGKFVEMELVPQADDAVASSAVAMNSVPAFSRADESAFTTRGIGAENADVVSRYFTPGFTAGTFTPSTAPSGDQP